MPVWCKAREFGKSGLQNRPLLLFFLDLQEYLKNFRINIDNKSF